MNTTNEIRIATGWVQATPSAPIHAYFRTSRGFLITACNGRSLNKPRPFGLYEADTVAPGAEGVCRTCCSAIVTGRVVVK